MRWFDGVLVMAALAGALSPCAAQTVVHGRLVDDGSQRVLAGGEVTLVGSEGRTHRRIVTDAAGYFRFDEVTPGPLRMRAALRGFETVYTPFLQAAAGDTIELEIRLDRQTVLLAPLVVVGRSRSRESARLTGFYDRLESSFGYFLTRDDIERRNPMYASDMLLTVPGVRLGGNTMGGRRTIYMTRAIRSTGPCPVQVFIDGFLMTRRTLQRQDGVDSSGAALFTLNGDDGFSLDDHVSPEAIEGIEVYKGVSDVPAEFWTPEASCGTVVVWTRRGR